MNKEDMIAYHALQAHWWMNSATNGHCLSRKLYHGITGNQEFTDAEKVSDAMKISDRHIEIVRECMEGE